PRGWSHPVAGCYGAIGRDEVGQQAAADLHRVRGARVIGPGGDLAGQTGNRRVDPRAEDGDGDAAAVGDRAGFLCVAEELVTRAGGYRRRWDGRGSGR